MTDQYKQIGNAVPGKMAKAVARAFAESLRFIYDEEAELETESPPGTHTGGNDTAADTSKEESVDGEKQDVDNPNGNLDAETGESNDQVVVEDGETPHGEAPREAEPGTQVVAEGNGGSAHNGPLESGEVEDGKPDDVTSMDVAS